MFLIALGVVCWYLYENRIIPCLYIVTTQSMVPTFNPGDVLIIRAVNPKSIRVGDIIAFDVVTYDIESGPIVRLPMIVVHRVIDIVEKNGVLYFKTKGDNNPAPDPWYVPEGGVVGVAEKLISLGRLGLMLVTPQGKAIVFLMTVLLILTGWVLASESRRGRVYV